MSTAPRKLAISGASGRMGQRLVRLVRENPDFELTGALESPDSPNLGKDAGLVAGVGDIGVAVTSDFAAATAGAEAFLDFSTPDAVDENIVLAAEKKIPAIIGVTGLGEDTLGKLLAASQKIPILHAPNMSFGINLLYRTVEEIAGRLGREYDIEIIEAHHNKKKDAPSGTALAIFEKLRAARNYPEDSAKPGRVGAVGPRPQKEIGIHAVRAGAIVGDHTVLFAGPGEVIEVTHRAQSRDAFATGALKASLLMVGKAPGLYSFSDVMGF